MSGVTFNRAVQLQSDVPDFPLSELKDLENDRFALPGSTFRIGLLIPMCGSAGIWAPSCIASAQVAVAELNSNNGIGGRSLELIMIDSAIEASTPVEEVINALIEIKAIDAIVGMHISAVRQNLSKIVKQRVPYVYTPLYEGGKGPKGFSRLAIHPNASLGPHLRIFIRNERLNAGHLSEMTMSGPGRQTTMPSAS